MHAKVYVSGKHTDYRHKLMKGQTQVVMKPSINVLNQKHSNLKPFRVIQEKWLRSSHGHILYFLIGRKDPHFVNEKMTLCEESGSKYMLAATESALDDVICKQPTVWILSGPFSFLDGWILTEHLNQVVCSRRKCSRL